MQRRLGRLLGLGAAILGSSLFISCDDNTPDCVPLVVTNDCICNTGDRGHRQCTADGLSLGACRCGVVANGGVASGAGGSAGTGGSSDSGLGDSNAGAAPSP